MDIVARAKGSTTRPREGWRAIAGEPSDAASLFKGWVVPVSAIPAAAGFVGLAVFARMFEGVLPGFSVGAPLARGVVAYVLGLAAVWVFGEVVQALAPRFGGTGEEVPAVEFAAYSPTAFWLAGVFASSPPLGVFTLLGLCGLYILHQGTPVVTGVPENDALVFTLALVVCAIAVNLLIGLAISPLLAM